MNYNNPDPPKTVGVRAKAVSSNKLTKKQIRTFNDDPHG